MTPRPRMRVTAHETPNPLDAPTLQRWARAYLTAILASEGWSVPDHVPAPVSEEATA